MIPFLVGDPELNYKPSFAIGILGGGIQAKIYYPVGDDSNLNRLMNVTSDCILGRSKVKLRLVEVFGLAPAVEFFEEG